MPARKKMADAERKAPVSSNRRRSRSKKNSDLVDGNLFEEISLTEPHLAAADPVVVTGAFFSTENAMPVTSVSDDPDKLCEKNGIVELKESTEAFEVQDPVTDFSAFLNDREKNRLKTSKNSKKRHALSSILGEWYGKENSGFAMLNHLPKTVTLGECLEKAMKRIVPPWAQTMEKIQENWEKIVGSDNVRKLTPAYIEKKTLFVELRHPMFRSAFDVPSVKSTIIVKVNSFAGASICSDIKFCARGEFQRKK